MPPAATGVPASITSSQTSISLDDPDLTLAATADCAPPLPSTTAPEYVRQLLLVDVTALAARDIKQMHKLMMDGHATLLTDADKNGGAEEALIVSRSFAFLLRRLFTVVSPPPHAGHRRLPSCRPVCSL